MAYDPRRRPSGGGKVETSRCHVAQVPLHLSVGGDPGSDKVVERLRPIFAAIDPAATSTTGLVGPATS